MTKGTVDFVELNLLFGSFIRIVTVSRKNVNLDVITFYFVYQPVFP